MTASINASTTSGVVVTSDTSGAIAIQSNGTAVATVASTGTTLAGTTTITTLSDGTNSTSSTNCIQGSAKAWVNFDGTVAIGNVRSAYNVSSVTKNGTGNYTVNFTNAMADANYSLVSSFNRNYNTSDGYGMGLLVVTRTTTNSKIYALFVDGGFYDQEYMAVSVFR
jgi:hypothetical protein